MVLLLHIPLMLPGMTLPPKELCGHQHWGTATDQAPQLSHHLPRPYNFPKTNVEAENRLYIYLHLHRGSSSQYDGLPAHSLVRE